MNRRHIILSLSLLLFASFSFVFVAAEQLPSQLSDETFWKLVTDFSEEGGYFRSDNFVSNETTFQWVIPSLKKLTKPGGVYLGVGPDQNFTYIVALEPKIAFIFDIRRQNMLQHLMYKSLLELSADRAEFLSRLFSRPRPADLGTNSTTAELFEAYDNVAASRDLFVENLAAIKKHLEENHKFKLSRDDEQGIEFVFRAFYAGGPDLTYNGPSYGGGFGGRGRMPTYAELMKADDGEGHNLAYIGSEENFSALQSLEKKNLVVPLVGDFAGPKAIRAVSQYLKDHDATVTAFYTSNVEQYLFQQADDWRKYYNNIDTLPLDSTSTFIRSVFNGIGMVRYPPQGYGMMRSVSILCSMEELVKAYKAGGIRSYYDVVNFPK